MDGLTPVSIFCFVGLLFVALGLPMAHGKIGPNPWMGFRTRKTLSDPAIWYPANAYCGRGYLWSGAVIILAAIALSAVPGLSEDQYAGAMAAVIVADTLVVTFLSYRYVSTLGETGDDQR